MSNILLWTIFLEGFLLIYGFEKPPEAVLPLDSIKPAIHLSLLSPESPREGDDVMLQCAAKPKNGSKSVTPDNVHWIKGNVGVPEIGHKPEAVRFVREKTEDDGIVMFTLTIKEAEVTDADNYMCIVQVGEKGYFTSNEVAVAIQPGDPEDKKKREEAKKDKEDEDLQEILSWRDRIDELSQEELKMLADALVEENRRKEEKEKAEKEKVEKKKPAKEKETTTREPAKSDTNEVTLTDEEKSLLQRRNELDGMSEIDLFMLAQALKKEKVVKENEKRKEVEEKKKKEKEAEQEKEEKNKKWKEDIENRKREAEEKERRESEKKREAEREKELYMLTSEEKSILQRKSELADFTAEEIKLLHKAMGKQKNIAARNRLNEERKKPELVLTDEEKAILARKDEMRSMSQEELKVMSKAVTKQKKIQDAKKNDQSKEEIQDESPRKRARLDEQAKEPISGEELLTLLKKDDVMNLSNDDLGMLARGLKKQQYLEDMNPNVGDGMTKDEMFNLLKRKDQILNMEQHELDSYMIALVKERNIKYGGAKVPEPTSKKVKDEASEQITNEEVLMLTKKDDIMNLGNDELPILASALKKQRAMEDRNPFTGEDMSENEMHQLLNKKDQIMDMEQDELDLFFTAMIKDKLLKSRPPRPEDEMSMEDMRRILKWQDGDVSQLSSEEFRLLGTALLKEKKLNNAKKKYSDPLEDEEIDVHDEL
ncbi:uncharacterized protein [Amphiura filiformis]|uniref:uncharacterized protein n=1 Tax=Amphiura filiformis TaxID=82378 RepID=UPI003B21B652